MIPVGTAEISFAATLRQAMSGRKIGGIFVAGGGGKSVTRSVGELDRDEVTSISSSEYGYSA